MDVWTLSLTEGSCCRSSSRRSGTQPFSDAFAPYSNTAPHYTTPHCKATPHNAPTPHHTTPHHATPHYTTPHHTTPSWRHRRACTGWGRGIICRGRNTHVPRGWTLRRQHTPLVCPYPRGRAPSSKSHGQHHGHALTLDHRHQRAGRRRNQGGASGGPHLDVVPPLHLCARREVPGPLPAGPNKPAGVAAGPGGTSSMDAV